MQLTDHDADDRPYVALATCAEHPVDAEGHLLLAALRALAVRAEPVIWTDEPEGGWDAYDLVVVRATWDYTFALPRFLDWTRAIGDERLLNPPDVIAWNADKRYLADLRDAGVSTIATEHLPPGAPLKPPPGRFVVKPAVAGGARGAQVFDDERHADARSHVARLHAGGHDLLVQPYLAAVDGDEGETALVFIEGALSHAMRKGPLLALDVPAVQTGFRAEQMSVVPAPAPDVVALGRRTLAAVYERFSRGPLLYARVDILRDAQGQPAVLELELIEPSLFLDFVPGSAEALARAIVARLPA
ncbi:MAG TPA: hypothetical protein VGV90_17105 [Solirubrobacteraceae bacterium]|nr:hypothetical protein [Solirubrobacteraceae bacterium]